MKALEEQICRFEEEIEELHEKQEKIVACLYTDKLISEKKLREAQRMIDENRLRNQSFNEKDKEISDLKATLEEEKGAIMRIEEKLTETNRENFELKKQLQLLDRKFELEQKQCEYTDSQTVEETSKQLQELYQRKESEMSKLTEKVYEKESQIVKLKVENLKINSDLKELKARHKMRESQLDQIRKEKDRSIESLTEIKLAFDQVVQENEQLREEKENLKSKSEEKDSKIESLIEQTFDKEIEIKELLEQNIDKDATIDSLIVDKQSVVNEKNLSRDEELTELRADLGKKVEEINKLAIDRITQAKHINDLQKYCAEKKHQAEKLQIENEEKLKEIAKKDDYLRRLHSEFIDIDEDIQKIKADWSTRGVRLT